LWADRSFGTVEPAVRLRPMLSDPNDEMASETAINGRADAIITFNERHFRRVAGRFGCSALLPVEAVRQLARDDEEEANQ
jgi:hypothetical protein